MDDSEKLKLAGKDGESDLDFKSFSVKNDQIERLLREEKEKASLNKAFEKDMNRVRDTLVKANYLNEDMTVNPGKAFAKGDLVKLNAWSRRNPDLILEVADNGKTRLYERKNEYGDVDEPYVKKAKVEYAEDDRVLGIPYAQAMAGDRVYIINGKVFTGWGLYFSLSSIKSPEDYARNVDLVYNVPYLWASVLLKAQLGLGVGFKAVYGSETNETSEEKLMNKYLLRQLRIDTAKLTKTGFHLGAYGNAYWALRRGKYGDVDKITILQPERLKIFLDPATTKILFYIYLPPIIGGTTIASYPDDGRFNPNILTGVTLSYPTPIVMHPEDVCHFKVNDFTEYPFGFSDVKTCVDPATARLDVNLLAPILYKKYTKPMIHWALKTEGIGPNQIQTKLDEMTSMLTDIEPGSDPVTTDRWTPIVINAQQGKSGLLNLTDDIDTQIFAATGAPETYFKARSSTDRMIAESDKTFIARMKIIQNIVADQIEEKLIKPRLYREMKERQAASKALGESEDVVEKILKDYDSWMASEPKVPELKWNETFKQDETQAIANAVVLLNAGIIDRDRAAQRIGEVSMTQQMREDSVKTGLDDMNHGSNNLGNNIGYLNNQKPPYNLQENMEMLRGGNIVRPGFAQSNRNVTEVRDPSQLGGSRYAQHKTHGEEPDISQKHSGLNGPKKELSDMYKVGDEIVITKSGRRIRGEDF